MMGASFTGFSDIWWIRTDTVWEREFNWLPRRSTESGKSIWLKHAWYGCRYITGPGDPVIQERWLTDEEYMWQQLQG